jgi:alpha-glucosidase
MPCPMKRSAPLRGPVLLALALAACAAAPTAARTGAPVPALRIESRGVVLELTAPRADIVRIRAGRGSLPEDASWAVAQELRLRRTPLVVSENAGVLTARTASLEVAIDRASLHVRVSDAAGRVLLDDAQEDALAFHGDRTAIRKTLPAGMHYFGLGDKTGPLDRRGQAFSMWNTDAYGFQPTGDPIYKSIPFLLGADETGRSFGLFLDNTWRSWFDFGRTEDGVLSWGAAGGPVDYYVMGGPLPRDVVQAYAWLTGTPPLPPLWALGFQQSRYSYMNEGEVRGIAARLRSDRLPADVIYLDIDYQDRNRPFTVDRRAFPDLAKLAADLRALGIRLVLITDLHIAYAPGEGYAPYDSGRAIDAFLAAGDGSTYVGKVWPGPAVFPDFSRAAVRDWWGGLYAGFVKDGASGFWNDMNEPAIFDVPGKTMPLDNRHAISEPGFAPRTASHAEMHNVYGMLNSRATFEGLSRLAPDTRPFVLTRASYAGGQRYAATWTGDNSSSWAHLSLSVAQLANLGLSGFSMSGDDIGGFAGEAPSAELLTRWIEVGAFNAIFRDHVAKDKPAQEPWVGGKAHEDIRRVYIEERYRLMPYLYGLAEEASRTGLPIVRPVFLEFPAMVRASGAGGPAAADFLFGPDLLVAPSPTPESPATYTVQLPGPGWTDYWTGERVEGNTVQETPRLSRLPVFVRPGAIVPRQPLVQSTGELPQGSLELAVYPGEQCAGSIYLDDGQSLAYMRGEVLRQRFTCTRDVHGALDLHFEARKGSYRPWWSGIEVVVHGWEGQGVHAELAGHAVPAQVDPAGHTLRISLPDEPATTTLHITP